MVKYIVAFIIAILALGGCTVKPPEVHVTAEKTALENQLFGEKARVSNDPSTSIAVWSALENYSWENQEGELLSIYRDAYNRRRLSLAQIRRKTMKEYIDELKRQGMVGESYEGRLVAVIDTLNSGGQIDRIISSENHDREIILDFYFESRGIVEESDKASAWIEFGQVALRLSPDGTKYEDRSGEWMVK